MRSEVKLRHRALINEVQVTKSSFMKHFQNATKKKKKSSMHSFLLIPSGSRGWAEPIPKNFSSYKIKTKLAHDKMFSLILNVPVRVTWTLLVAFVVPRWWTLPVLVTSSHLLCHPTKMSNLMTMLTAEWMFTGNNPVIEVGIHIKIEVFKLIFLCDN